MKKIFTLVLILATVSSFAQSLMLSHEGNPLHHGDTVDVMVSCRHAMGWYFSCSVICTP